MQAIWCTGLSTGNYDLIIAVDLPFWSNPHVQTPSIMKFTVNFSEGLHVLILILNMHLVQFAINRTKEEGFSFRTKFEKNWNGSYQEEVKNVNLLNCARAKHDRHLPRQQPTFAFTEVTLKISQT
jgi:hypothetical protein